MWDKKGEDISFNWFYKLKERLLKEQQEAEFSGERESAEALAALSDEELVKYASARANKCNSIGNISVGNPDKEKVEIIQKALADAGANITDPAGTFGPTTLIATIAAQKQTGIRTDGCVGPETIEALKLPFKGRPQPKNVSIGTGKCRYKKSGNTRRTRELMQSSGFDYTEGRKGRIKIDPQWQRENVVRIKLHTGKTIRIHRQIATLFAKAFKEASEVSGYAPRSVQTQVARHILWDPSKPVSNHSYGMAIDFNPRENPYGMDTGKIREYPEFINIMNCYGFLWGGDWSTPDDMHFEFDVTRL